MNHAATTGALVLVGAGLFTNAFLATHSTMQAVASPQQGLADDPRFLDDPRGMLRRGDFEEPCYPENAPVDWAVFEPVIRPLTLVRGGEFLECFDIGDDSLLDLDGDGQLELLTEDGAGFTWDSYNGEQVTPFTSIRRDGGGLALDVVLNFSPDLSYWLGLIGSPPLPSDGRLEAESQGFIDVDGDGMLDLIMKVSLQDYFDDGPGTSGYFWYRNALEPVGRSCTSDLTNDGRVNGADLSFLLSDWTG